MSGLDLPRLAVGAAPIGHDQAISAIVACAATVSTLSYQEAIEGYLKLRGISHD